MSIVFLKKLKSFLWKNWKNLAKRPGEMEKFSSNGNKKEATPYWE
jgi:hypothetical protein